MRVPRPRFLLSLATSLMLAGALVLPGCGGGGGGGEAAPTENPSAPAAPAPVASKFPPSSTLAGICTIEGQKQFVRSYLDEVYLWADEITDVDPAEYSTLSGYFNALLVKTPDVTGRPKDRFSSIQVSAPTQQGAALALNTAGLAQRDLVPTGLLSTAPTTSVPLWKVITSAGGRKVGYVLFNDHHAGAQDVLISVFGEFRAAAVDDLVLDMRFNSGGFLYVAQTVASMVTGPASSGLVFEQLRYNAKRASQSLFTRYLFSDRLQTSETNYQVGYELPQLKLPRVYVLASGLTCSASESVINSLRGIDVEVILVGATTCGKPYGFERRDNCGAAIFPIEFQGYNAKNFGDYMAGFQPTCPVTDDFSTALGATTEPLLFAALRHIDTGSCPGSPATSALKSLETVATPGQRLHVPTTSEPLWGGRLLKTQQ
jgi:hypothetical protein